MTSSNLETVVPQSPDVGDYVLPQPRRSGVAQLIGAAGIQQTAAHRQTAKTARLLGEHLALLADSQQHYLAELRSGLESLDGAIADAARVRLKSQVHELVMMLDWCDALREDLQQKSRWAACGWQPIDLGDLCTSCASEFRTGDVPVYVTGDTDTVWWGDADRLAAAMRAALDVVTQRTAGLGALRICVEAAPTGPRLHVASSGEPSDDPDPSSIRTFRAAAELLGARVVPPALGAGGAGLVIELPDPES